MPDIADLAQVRIERELDAAIAAARGICPPARDSADNCEECGCQIPSARQVAMPGTRYCVDCADYLQVIADRKAGRL